MARTRIAPLRWLHALQMAGAKRGRITGILALTVSVGALGALEPLLLKNFLDGVSQSSSKTALFGALALLCIVGLLREVVGAVSNWLIWRSRIDFQHELLDATVDRLHSLPLSYHRSQDVGGMITRLDRGIQGVVTGLSELTFNVLPAAIFVIAAAVVMVRLDPRATLLVFAFLPVPAVVTALTTKEQAEREKSLVQQWSSIYGRFNEVLSGIVTVKSFAMEEREKTRFLRGVQKANEAVVRGVWRDSWIGSGKNSAIVLARVAALGWGGYWASQGQSSVGTVVAFLTFVNALFVPFQGLLRTYQTVEKTSASLDLVFSILNAQDSLGDASNALDVPHVRGDVQFQDVWFGFDRRRTVLSGIDLKVAAGELVAIVGPSGSGKTTMMALLQRLYDPTRGVIRVDGQDLRALKQRALRRHIGVVLREGLLFNDTIFANIAYGRPEASRADVEAAAHAARAHEFIAELPRGYDTNVGERGSHLAANQRQRIAIARALLKAPAILILDEPSNAFDAESEALVQDALELLVKDRTTFVITDRLNTAMHASRILVLKDGLIREEGRHEELILANGYYASLYENQVRSPAGAAI
jgi:ATP-binding cassette subfamily B protein